MFVISFFIFGISIQHIIRLFYFGISTHYIRLKSEKYNQNEINENLTEIQTNKHTTKIQDKIKRILKIISKKYFSTTHIIYTKTSRCTSN
jgi:hypothetical protein